MPYYESNLEALQKRNPSLAARVEAAAPEAEVLTAGDGQLVLRVAVNGRRLFLHSRFKPQQEAARAVTGLDLARGRLFGALGLGCGYYVEEILARIHQRAGVIVLETRPGILRSALSARDLRHLLLSPRLRFVDAAAIDADSQLQNAIISMSHLTERADFFATPAYADLWPEEVAGLRSRLLETIRYVAMIAGNSPEDTLIGLTQMMANAPHLLSGTDLAARQGTYTGAPAFCVAAGPSLNKNIQYLREVNGRGLIICADTILQRLLAEGIVPDAVCVLERGEIVYDYFFRDRRYPPEVTLVGQSVIWPEIFATFPGLKTVALKAGLIPEQWLGSLLPHLALFPGGSSVGNMNFGLARFLGCDPIVLVGQDLAYGEEGESHARGTAYEKKPVTSSDSLTEKPEYILGKNGKMLRTRVWWKNFHRWFEIEVGRTSQRCLDATEGGALIHGTEIVCLKDVVAEFCRAPVKRLRETLEPPDEKEQQKRLESLSQGLEKEIKALQETKKTISKTLKRLGEFERAGKNARREQKSMPVRSLKQPIEKGLDELLKMNPLFAFILQPVVMTLNWKNSEIGNIENLDDCLRWSIVQRGFLETAGQLADISTDVFRKGLQKVRQAGEELDLKEEPGATSKIKQAAGYRKR